MSERGGRGSVASSRGARDLHDLLADAVDRGLVVGQSSVLAVRRLDPVAVELLVRRDRARGEVERRGARVRLGVDEDGAAVGAVEVAARALGLREVALERAAVALDHVALELPGPW